MTCEKKRKKKQKQKTNSQSDIMLSQMHIMIPNILKFEKSTPPAPEVTQCVPTLLVYFHCTCKWQAVNNFTRKNLSKSCPNPHFFYDTIWKTLWVSRIYFTRLIPYFTTCKGDIQLSWSSLVMKYDPEFKFRREWRHSALCPFIVIALDDQYNNYRKPVK